MKVNAAVHKTRLIFRYEMLNMNDFCILAGGIAIKQVLKIMKMLQVAVLLVRTSVLLWGWQALD